MEAAALIRSWRRQSGLSQRALAERLGVPQSTVARWEAGHAEPPFARVAAIAGACGRRVRIEAVPYDPAVRAQIRGLLAVTPSRRLDAAANAGRLILRGRHASVVHPGG